VAKGVHKRASDREAPRLEAEDAGPSGARATPTAAEAEQRLRTAERALRQRDRQILHRAPAIYLNGEVLDRGVLRLTHPALRFDGWQGSIVIPVGDIVDVRLGTSVLPRHAGIPLLGRLWPGKPRYAESLVLTVRVGSASEPRVATVAGLKNGALWRDEILRCRDGYEAWMQERSRHVTEIKVAERDLAQAREAGAPAADEKAQDGA
jgi:hypothetical protein